MMAVDGKKAAVLVLLDLSAAFDTTDHAVLFSRLENMFELTGCVLQCFHSYLHRRSQSVLIHETISEACCSVYLDNMEFNFIYMLMTHSCLLHLM